jgi:hypothetical protein
LLDRPVRAIFPARRSSAARQADQYQSPQFHRLICVFTLG